MLRAFIVNCILLLFPVQLLRAQDEPTHSISELSALLQKSKADSERVILLLEAGLVYVMKPGMEKNDFDSALFFTTDAMNLSNKLNDRVLQARCFRVYSQLYRESNQTETGKNYINRAISIFTKENVKDPLADAYFELQLYYNAYSDSEWVFKVRFAEMAERLYRESGNKLKLAGALKHLGDFYQIAGKDSIALKCLHEALAIYKSLQFEEVQGVYDLIGTILCTKGNLNQALKYGLLAIATAEKLKTNSHELSTIYNRVGITCYRLTRYAEAGNYFTRSFDIASGNKDTTALMHIGPNVLGMYLKLGKQNELIAFLQQLKFMYDKGGVLMKTFYLSNYVGAYLITGNHKKAEPFVRQMFRLVDNSNDINLNEILHTTIIPYYFAAGQYADMYKYLPSNEDYCKKNNIIVSLADNYLWWFKADSALRNYPAAIAHYKLYKEASDSSFRITATRNFNELLVEYESTKKDQEIAVNENNIKLLTQQDLLQKSKLQQGVITRNISFAVVTLLIVIMALLYGRYRLKQITNKKLELQQREIAQQNLSLHHLVNEKEWLVKEIHHRVKNNFQIVMGLLGTQSGYLKNEVAINAIEESQHRVQAMSLIHQKLYQTENLSAISMPDYVHELVDYLRDSFNIDSHIRFTLQIEPIELDLAHCIPLGLILNEAITNSFKYAFPNKMEGKIDISLKRTSTDHLLLTITDNGIGLPAGSNGAKRDSMGMNLMGGLSEEIGASLSIHSEIGTSISVSFTYNPEVTAMVAEPIRST